MKNIKPRIYVDTSVISYYTARMHRDPVIRARQLATKRWWDGFAGLYEFCVSPTVFHEIGRGSDEAVNRRRAVVQKFRVLDFPSEHVSSFADQIFERLGFPQRSLLDAFHLAFAALGEQNYIVSWNFKHMANVNVRRRYREICSLRGLATPEIFTPEELLERGDA